MSSEMISPRGRDALVHHTTDAVQSSLLRSPGFWLTTLPTERHAHGKHVKDAAMLKGTWPSSCQSHHSRLGLFLTCQKIAHRLLNLCEEVQVAQHGRLPMRPRSSPALTLCDHPDACFGSEECPVWPKFTGITQAPWCRHKRCGSHTASTTEAFLPCSSSVDDYMRALCDKTRFLDFFLPNKMSVNKRWCTRQKMCLKSLMFYTSLLLLLQFLSYLPHARSYTCKTDFLTGAFKWTISASSNGLPSRNPADDALCCRYLS